MGFFTWAEVMQDGTIVDLITESGFLTPDEARAKAADLLAAVEVVERELYHLHPGVSVVRGATQ
jgi:hypothetical protein